MTSFACPDCGAPVERRAGRGRPRVRCQGCQAAADRASNDASRRRWRDRGEQRLEPRPCGGCDVTVVPPFRWCPSCRVEQRRANVRARRARAGGTA